MSKFESCSVYFTVSDKFTPVPELYCVEIKRHSKDLGVSIVLQATCELMARREVFRLFPEYKHSFVLMQVSLARYAEFDWQTGRCIVARRDRPPEVPPCIAAANKPQRKRLPPIEEGDAQ